MTIPSYSTLMLPLLQLAGDGAEHRLTETVEILADYVGLSVEERTALTPDGRRPKFAHRVRYAATCLRKAGLLERAGQGVFRITAPGLNVLKTSPLHIDRTYLLQFPSFVDFVTRYRPDRIADAEPTELVEADHTPRELIDILFTGLQKELADELLESIMNGSPAFFERLVLDLLIAMGYGANRAAASRTLGRTGDGGVDGVIQEDKLGLDVVYIQAKRYARQNVVGRPLVQAFIGSLIGQGASRGVMLTTSRFSKEAIEYARSMQQHKVILIDGQQLTQLMIEHNVGVTTEATYVLKKPNREYFESK